MTAFARLASSLQYHVVNTLGWASLRPVQELTIEAVLDGDNCVVLAPTAGGKTESAFFPLLSAMDQGDWRPVSVLYLSPIRALLNNQEARVQQYAELVGRRAFKWHGDVGPSARKRFLKEPADVLLTTPESLEAMLMSANVPARRLFAGLQAVVVDEVHAFANDDRGAHLCAVLERLQRFSGRDFQRLGLSATVGNPDEILRWLQGSSARAARVVSPPREQREPALSLDYVGSLENAARVVRELHPGKKRLLFADSRAKVESLGRLLRGLGVDTFVIHGSLSHSERADAERAFGDGKDCVIVSTSALELGIDVGDLDHVLQIDAPGSVSSFLQRMGRTGRRSDRVANCTFLATKSAAVLEAAAIIALQRRGFVEDVEPERAAVHVLAQQIMALAIQHGGVAKSDVFAWLAGATAFAEVSQEAREALITFMLEREILSEHEGLLWLGREGERVYGRRHFAELYAVFSTPRVVTVRWHERDVGSVDAQFLETLAMDKQRSTFVLGGRAWQVLAVDWARGVCAVEPTETAAAARWPGSPRYLSYALCQAMREVVLGTEVDPCWSTRARTCMEELRAEHAFLNDVGAVVSESDSIKWWNFAGGRANLLLARMLEAELGGRCIVRNTTLELRDGAGESVVAFRECLRRFAKDGRPSVADLAAHADGATRSRLSKFEACLPEGLLLEFVGSRAFDREGARRAVGAGASAGSADTN